MQWFDYERPRALADALSLMARHDGDARALAGGTDLITQMRAHRKEPRLLVDLKKIEELNTLECDGERGLTLGAAVPCFRIYTDPRIRRLYPAIAETAAIIGGTQIQTRASFGGNLCNASPSADTVPLMIALGARCRIASAKGERTVPVESFCTAPGCTILEPGELLVSLHVPPPEPGSGACYLRFIPRNEMDIAVAGAGVSIVLRDGVIRSARIALAAVAPTPLFVPQAGLALEGRQPSAEAIEAAAQAARDAARPIDDMRGTAAYRRHLSAVLTRRALTSAIAHARGGN